MAKKFKLTIVVETTDDFDPRDFKLVDDDVIDGFQLTRENGNWDVTEHFQMTSGHIQNIQEL